MKHTIKHYCKKQITRYSNNTVNKQNIEKKTLCDLVAVMQPSTGQPAKFRSVKTNA